jgi:acyl-CoA thioester hydrolase
VAAPGASGLRLGKREGMSERFRYYLRVRYHDCDMQRVVFNANFATYVDIACTEFMKALMPGRHSLVQGKFELHVVRQVLEWKAPARFDDVLEIAVWCPRLGTTSFTLAYEFRKAAAGASVMEAEPFVTAETINVSVDGHSWQKTPIPDWVRPLLERGAPGVVVDHAGWGAT